MPVVLLFLDGVGIGKHDPEFNPFFFTELPTFKKLCDGEFFHAKRRRISSATAEVSPVSATLGMPGLPQSGTGQTAIFTGTNGAKEFGRHFGPFPPTKLRPIIERDNIFTQLKSAGKSVCFANAFPKRFFEYTQAGTRRLSVTTLAAQYAGMPLLTTDDLKKNAGISADFTRERWEELGNPAVPVITPFTAGEHCAAMAREVDFLLFEYWLTDHAGHSQKKDFASNVLVRFDEFLAGLLEHISLATHTILLVSDHGNIEDLSVKTHTRNPIPGIFLGPNRRELAERITTLTRITPTIVRLLTERG